MSFTTISFLVFFAIVFWGYYLIPKKWQWIWLLIGSLVFYAFSAWWALLFLLGTVTIVYFGARWIGTIERSRKKAIKECSKEEKPRIKKQYEGKKKSVLALVLVVLLGTFIFLRYTNFALDLISRFTGNSLPTLSLIVPIGLSFYLFQEIGYLVDVYRGQYEEEQNFLKFTLYISYFPHLLQGPLDDYSAVTKELYAQHDFDYTNAVEGAKRAAWGFFKKMVVANQCAVIINPVLSSGSSYDGISVIVSVILYAIELYADFSGYMDIAIGCSRMLSIPIAENFDSPYFSKSIAEYWRRWHITLGTWFRNYLFYPLMRSKPLSSLRSALKKNKYLSSVLPTAIALFIVWLLIGFWHGSNLAYVAHGLIHGSFIILDTVMSPLYDKFHKKFPKVKGNVFFRIFQIVRTFSISLLGYYFFAPGSISIALTLLKNSLHLDISLFGTYLYVNARELIVIILGVVLMTIADVYKMKGNGESLNAWVNAQKKGVRYLLYFLLIFSTLLLMVYGGEAGFAYFKF